ncbi:MAG: hypothetical protein A3E87_04790 [Gammaproteobacteria bacterium RIFCSPHIGHO2_12_FULL_35_23]|nr:MAG: hypothetical protein A3E87_04790 [Gammaproteobacteria bacterium RIFCSPHIGHO2_12_FULL_35_23]
MNWAEEEMCEANLGDERLNNRLKNLLTVLSQSPTQSIPTACGGWAETKAAYCFFANRKVSADKILTPHFTASIERIKQHPVVLLLQDTTSLNFTGQSQREDIGPINHEKHLGILLHPTIAVTPDRLCLGVMDTHHWARKQLHHRFPGEKSKVNHKIPLADKESYRWLRGYQKAQEIATQVPQVKIISVADREGDLYDVYYEEKLNQTHHITARWLIRAKTNRKLVDENNALQQEKLIETVKKSQPIGYMEFELPSRKKQQKRIVKQVIYVSTVRLSLPDRKRKKKCYPSVETQVVIASELNAPPGQTPLEWILLTDIEINNKKQAQDIVKWYLCRWQIEVYFRVLKSGCRIEKLQLETKDRFDACLAMYMIIAWRILYLTFITRLCPSLPCNHLFTQEEWHMIYIMVYRKKPSKKPPPLSLIMNIMAQFGGYLNRKGDISPGPTAIWIGLQRVKDFIMAKQALIEANY